MFHVSSPIMLLVSVFALSVVYNLVKHSKPRFLMSAIVTVIVMVFVSFLTNSRYVFLF